VPASNTRDLRNLRRRRLPSGRHPEEQPNVAPEPLGTLGYRFWLLVLGTGVAAGLFGDLMMFVLREVQHAGYAYRSPGEAFQNAVEATSWGRRIIVLAVGGLLAGLGWYALRRWVAGRSDVDHSLWTASGELGFRRSLGTSLLSEFAVGAGASLGREAAPKLMGAASASMFGEWARLAPGQRRLLVACGAGAGMAAVYNVPLGGALMALEIMYGGLSLSAAMPALLCSGVATAVSWIYLPIRPTYTDVPAYHVHASQLVWSLLAGPVIGLVSVGYVRLIGWTSANRVSGPRLLVAPLLAFVALALIGLHFPQLLGNGKDVAHEAFLGGGTAALLLGLFALKPVVTAMCLGSGATGGLFTPTMSTGAMFGGLVGLGWSQLWPGAPLGSYAVIGAAAMVGAGMQAPVSALVLMVELTHTTDTLIVPMVIATGLATLVARTLDGYSIYTARLPALVEGGAPLRQREVA
jgi:CIC family chloride channel protein